MKQMALFVILIAFSGLATAANQHVRQGATGNGSDWSNALPDLPSSFVRGDTYYVADGSYSGRAFSGTGTEYITIKKATEGEHGTGTGWQTGYGNGQAVFGDFTFSNASRFIFDGVIEDGFKIENQGFRGTVLSISNSSNITVKNSDMDGKFATLSEGQATSHTAGACNAVNITGSSFITIENNKIHDAADDGLMTVSNNNLDIIGNEIYNLHGCGTDGGCGPCYNGHSDGLEIQNTDQLLIEGNFLHHIQSTAGMITGQWPGQPTWFTTNLTMRNNIFYTPATGVTAYIYYVRGADIYNNVFWGRTQGQRFGGVAFGPQITDMDFYNNIVLNINYNHLGGVHNPTEHRINNNLFAMISSTEYTANTDDIVADPLFTNIVESSNMADHLGPVQASDFSLQPSSPAINSGTTVGAAANDFFGNTRDSQPDRGAIEFGGIGTCSDTNVSCGTWPNCQNCNSQDECNGSVYSDYSCSGTSCSSTEDDCSDCSCSCGGFNETESAANGNCSDGIDNDCDSLTDEEESACDIGDYTAFINFEQGNEGSWTNYNPGGGSPGWSIADDSGNGGTNVLRLDEPVNEISGQTRLGAYRILNNVQAEDFILEGSLRSTSSSDYRDLGIIFAYQNENEHYVVILNNACDSSTNGIFKVSATAREKIGTGCASEGIGQGSLTNQQYHNFKIERDGSSIEFFFDDLANPVFTANDSSYGLGSFGFGSINDSGIIDNIAVTDLGQECINTMKLLEYISSWKEGSMPMISVLQKISLWKAGTGC